MNARTSGYSFFVVIVALMTVCLIVISGVVAETDAAPLPTRTLGDKWTYSVDFNQPNTINGTWTMEVTNTSIAVNGYNCNEITYTGIGSVTGNATVGWTINGKEYDLRTDYSITESYISVESSSSSNEGSISLVALNSDNSGQNSVTTETDYNPPYEINKGFPLFVGENWTAATTENLTTSYTTITGYTFEDSSNKSLTTHVTVLGTEDTKVPAGEFQTYLINATSNDGTSRL